jgi:excisionase family DNA binding protein
MVAVYALKVKFFAIKKFGPGQKLRPLVKRRKGILMNQTANPNIQIKPIVVDLQEAATMLRCCQATIRREIGRGNIRAFRLGRVWRIRIAELQAYLKRLESAA